MKHLTQTDLVLFATKWQNLSQNSEEKSKHIKTCLSCRKQLETVQKVLNTFKINNEKQCSRYFEHLLKYMEKVDQPPLTPELKHHLEDCEMCTKIYETISILSPLDYASNLNFKIPKNIFDKIDMKIYAELEKLDIPQHLGEIAASIKTTIENSFRTLKVSVIPVPALNGIRGENETKSYIFTHSGGKIQLKIGIANNDVKLFGIFEDQIFTKKTDLKGNVIFDDLPKDDYRVEVRGHAVSEIKAIPLN